MVWTEANIRRLLVLARSLSWIAISLAIITAVHAVILSALGRWDWAALNAGLAAINAACAYTNFRLVEKLRPYR